MRLGLPVVALVGYTNAGKSTLLNRLSRAGVLAENMLFATLGKQLVLAVVIASFLPSRYSYLRLLQALIVPFL